MLTADQCRAGRALVSATQERLAEVAGVNKRTIMDFEVGKRNPNPATLKAIAQGLQSLGVEVIEENGGGVGVRLAKRGANE